MWLSDTSVRRPVLAMVMNLILIAFGVVAYTRLQVREYPDIEPPIVTVETYYRGASASVSNHSLRTSSSSIRPSTSAAFTSSMADSIVRDGR